MLICSCKVVTARTQRKIVFREITVRRWHTIDHRFYFLNVTQMTRLPSNIGIARFLLFVALKLACIRGHVIEKIVFFFFLCTLESPSALEAVHRKAVWTGTGWRKRVPSLLFICKIPAQLLCYINRTFPLHLSAWPMSVCVGSQNLSVHSHELYWALFQGDLQFKDVFSVQM